MKKFFIPILAAILAVSCSKADYQDFRGSYQPESGKAVYMQKIVEVYFTDHLWLMERALLVDDIGSSGRRLESFETDGKSIWETGACWKAGTAVQALSGATVEKMQEDSTWVVKRDAEANFWIKSFPTRSEVILRMRPTAEDAPNHEWDLSVVNFVRTENKGYKAEIYTEDPAEFRVADSEDAWGSCKGKFWMTVTCYDKPVDIAVLSYNGGPSTAVFVNGL